MTIAIFYIPLKIPSDRGHCGKQFQSREQNNHCRVNSTKYGKIQDTRLRRIYSLLM